MARGHMAAERTAQARGARTERPRRVPLVPKEHGASFMSVHALLLGLVAGLVGGTPSVTGLVLALGLGATFLPLSAAVSVLTHPATAEGARRRAGALAALMAGLGALALWHGPAPDLLAVAAVAAGLGGLYAGARVRTGARSIPTQLAAIAGISLLAPLTWLLVGGSATGWPLSALAAFLSFGGTVPYVRERVRRRRHRGAGVGERLRGGALALAWQALALGLAAWAAAVGLVHPLVAVAFAPGAIKTAVGLARPESAPPMRHLGYLETVVSTGFAVLAGLGLGL